MDYWHSHRCVPVVTWGGVLFLDLNSSQNTDGERTPEYNYAQSVLNNSNPACVVAVYHEPAVTSDTTIAQRERHVEAVGEQRGRPRPLNGHQRNMQEYKPPRPELHGGDPRRPHGSADLAGPAARAEQQLEGLAGIADRVVEGQDRRTAGSTLDGAVNGNAATSISWQWQDVNERAMLHDGSVDCGTRGEPRPGRERRPGCGHSQTAQHSATMQGSVTDDGLPSSLRT